MPSTQSGVGGIVRTVGGLRLERWAPSPQNGGRHQIGRGGRLTLESAAVAHHLVEATSAEGVADCLKCSLRTAQALTEDARAEARSKRDAEIAAMAADGKTVRRISEQTGASVGTVHAAVQKAQTAKTEQPGPVISDRVRAWFSPEAQRWSELLRALEVINALPEPDIMLETPDHDLDHALLPALRNARLRLVTLWEILDV